MRNLALRILAIAFALAPAADSSAQPARYQFRYEVPVKPGMSPQYEQYVKKIVEAGKKTQAQPWIAVQHTTGTPGGTYSFVLPFEKWADRDSWLTPQQMLAKAFGEAEATKIASAGQAAMESFQTSVAELQKDLSGKPGSTSGVAANYLVSVTQVKPDRIQDYRLALSKIRAAEAKASGTPERVARRVIEGDRFLFSSVAPFASGAARDAWPEFSDFMGAMYPEEEIRHILATL
jgi:hypothetical protein